MTKPSRYWARLFLAFINKSKVFLIIGVSLGILIFLVFMTLSSRSSNNTQRIGIIGEYRTTNLPASITTLVSMGLTQIDDSGKAVPAIAKSWDIKDQGKTWVFHLNENLTWQDGKKVTAADINYNFSDASVAKPNNYTLTFKLKTPLSDFAQSLSKPAFRQGLLGVGSWKVDELSLSGTYVQTLSLKDKNGSSKLFKFYPTEDQAKLAFELGQIDSIDDLTNVAPFESWETVNVTPFINKQQYVAVFFNTADEVLGSKDIRQALSYAIDKESLSPNRALGPISPNSWAYNPSVKPYDFNIDHAKELLGSKKDLTIRLTTEPDLLPVAEKIAQNWKALGITTTLQITSFAPDTYQAFLAAYSIPLDPDQYSIWHSTQMGGNITRYKNTRIDKLLEDGRLETDQMKRKSIYFDFQKYLLEDAPAAFLYNPTYYNITRK